MNLISKLKSKIEDDYYTQVPYEIINKEQLDKRKKVTVIVPVYNAFDYLEKTVDSVIVQTLGFENITLILVDDGSSDGSRHLMRKFSKLYPNVVSVFLKQNTGTPAFPRNLGAHLAKSKYAMFLDADDWLSHDGIQVLYELMEKTKVNYAVGKSIQVDSKKKSIIGRYESSQDREGVSPFSIKHLFYHLGPRARMMKLDVLKKNKIRYPEMKYAEDKQFFIDVLLKSPEISTTTEPVYYLNRMDGNDSLTKQTDVMEKMDSNIKVLKYVLDKKLPPSEEKMIVNRLIEFDSITRLFDRKHFLKSADKQMYYDKFQEVIDVFEGYNRPYRIEDNLIKPISKVIYTLFMEDKYLELEQLIDWSKNEKNKEPQIIESRPYHKVNVDDDKQITVPIPFVIESSNVEVIQNEVKLKLKVTGHKIPSFERVKLQHRKHIEEVEVVALKVEEEEPGVMEISMEIGDFQSVAKAGYIFYLMYEDYEQTLVPIRMEEDLVIPLQSNKELIIYSTVKDHVGLKIK